MRTPELQARLRPSELRKSILKMARAGNSVHIACAFSLAEIVSTLYSDFVPHEKSELNDALRTQVILSKGHGVMALYAAFEKLGWLDPDDLKNYFADGSRLHGLSEAKIPGLEVSSGSLGHGLPIATGVALGLKRRGSTNHVYCLVGDGEMNEGPMWEALLFASHHKLDNLTVIVDANGFQAMGTISDVLNLEPFADKFKSFGFETFDCDGHDVEALRQVLSARTNGRPKAIVARTVKGKGVSFMENDNTWHYRRLDDGLMDAAMAELEKR